MTQAQTTFRYSPYLYEVSTEPHAWVVSSGEVLQYGLPTQDLETVPVELPWQIEPGFFLGDPGLVQEPALPLGWPERLEPAAKRPSRST